ncbi:3'-5' exonuclease [Synechococcus sp. Cruz-9H2]|uniref:3'-5' exonuclease n=1 Tax=unclassified Synechococcus TaxID=2626047 RepID=UPI0020CD15EF|nr:MULTISPECIES: 3'-5' exonuclease [unclassified Synechococcus]MCP9818543.1 3'-5' exonuclease [Synechococcus sp. Cruz-9H2]MCP9842774.1 3'-5' exonuclease [Synechococcus sp. Edmonson 11F2]MCP9855439.1 3'-5' exonuclease [Synechococcus sp. Cruz-9C9]MCP9862314.1 3'-5' exonuclease [Synechococcus sp. Cruz-7E5]MCP9869586.1 3'-5' exonuclease [Synechococcus sp. Cruz-7B9]
MAQPTHRWQQTSLLSLVPAAAEAGLAEPAFSEPACIEPARSETASSEPACPQQLLILDTETTGLDPERDHCIEVGAVLFHVPSRAVLSQLSLLLPCQSNPAKAINGIDAAVSRLEQPWQAGLIYFQELVASADAMVAHNAAFDRAWFGRGHLPGIEKPWICSMEDLRWPSECRLKATPSVRDLALAYGIPVWAAHRALTDCIYLAQVFERCEALESLLLAGLEPRRLYRAELPYEQRHRAREAGFRWNEPVAKAWSRRLSEREVNELDFPVRPVEPDAAGRHAA